MVDGVDFAALAGVDFVVLEGFGSFLTLGGGGESRVSSSSWSSSSEEDRLLGSVSLKAFVRSKSIGRFVIAKEEVGDRISRRVDGKRGRRV